MATDASTTTVVSSLPLEFLKTITDNFSPAHKIGQGGFGTVYWGTLVDGTKIAIKKLEENSLVTRDKQFKNEVESLMEIRHENIVKLVAFCHETRKEVLQNNGRLLLQDITHVLLCYEYLPMGSLEKYIFAGPLHWNKRFIIIKGICKGLHFLHTMERPIIHMDLKPDNILLDENMQPKIADFGLSRLFGEGQTRVVTQNFVAARGYVAPEYVYSGEISTRSDIYSLGLLIIEIATGERNSSFGSTSDMSAVNFINSVRQNWTDEYTSSRYPSDCLEEVKICISIGLRCVEHDRNKRPTMEAIVNELNEVRAG